MPFEEQKPGVKNNYFHKTFRLWQLSPQPTAQTPPQPRRVVHHRPRGSEPPKPGPRGPGLEAQEHPRQDVARGTAGQVPEVGSTRASQVRAAALLLCYGLM